MIKQERTEKMHLFILLPCFNEEKALPCLFQSICELIENKYNEYEVVVVNDGSRDNTEDTAKQWEGRLNLRVLSHSRNMGLGQAVNTGLSYINEVCSDDDIVVIMDGDNTHTPQIIPNMIEKLADNNDVVIASRYESGGEEVGLSFFRKFCSRTASLLLKLCFNIPGVKDYTCGYRLYKGNTIRNAYRLYGSSFIEEKGFTCMAEILIKLHYIGCNISEVPLVLRYDLKKGRSKMKVANTIRHYFILIRSIRHYRQILSREPVLINGKEK